MPASPWRTFGSPERNSDFVALLSYLPLKSYRRVFPFVFYTVQVAKQLESAQGLLGYSLLARPLSKRFWTLSVWKDEDALRAFVQHPPHVRVMTALAPHMDKTQFVRWMVKGSQLPLRWDDALRRSELIETQPTGGEGVSTKIVTSVGDANAQKRFIESHKAFLEEFPALEALVYESSKLADEKCYPESQSTLTGAEPADEEVAQKVVLSLETAIFDDFGELLILAGNGMGMGAKKILSSMYERLVTAMFIAKFPSEARIFLEHSDIEKGKVLNRAIATVPELVQRDFTPEEIERIQSAKKTAEAKKNIEYCKKCNQPKTDEAWTRVDLDAMARKVGDDLLKMYSSYYLVPTLLTHATPFGLDIRFRKTDATPDYRALNEEYARSSVWRGHYLMLWLLRHQDSYFNLGLASRIDARCTAFSAIWPENIEGS
jgi:heme-degrading monooxygenase HmoA